MQLLPFFKRVVPLLIEARHMLTPTAPVSMQSDAWHHPGSRFVTWVWSRLYAMRPMLVGGCRSIELRE